MKILVTGANGFLGGSLVEDLAFAGHYVRCAIRTAPRQSQITKKFEWVFVNWDSYFSLREITRNVDVVIHAAGVDAELASKNPMLANSFNGTKTLELLNAAISNGVKKFIYLSTAHVYSDNLIGEINENTLVKNLHPYATSHKAGEDSVINAHNLGRIQGLVIRLSNVFGIPSSNSGEGCWKLFINEACKSAALESQITIRSSGESYRDFLPLNEFKEIIKFLLKNNINGIINIGSGESYKIKIIANQIVKIFEKIGPEKINLKILKPEFGPDNKFIYSNNALKEYGYSYKYEFINELSGLARYCNEKFRK